MCKSHVVHQKPAEGMECAICMDDITEENYVEYKNSNGMPIKNISFTTRCCLEYVHYL